ncbi:MAG: hypothetical protein WCG36_05870, partial [bacterium]
FGVWMCLYGLAHMGYRHSLPAGIIGVGLFYQAAGVAFLLLPFITFMNPWPMGLVFFAGESVGGLILRSGATGEPAEPESNTEGDDPDEPVT